MFEVYTTNNLLVNVEDLDPSKLMKLEDEDMNILLSKQEEDELELLL